MYTSLGRIITQLLPKPSFALQTTANGLMCLEDSEYLYQKQGHSGATSSRGPELPTQALAEPGKDFFASLETDGNERG